MSYKNILYKKGDDIKKVVDRLSFEVDGLQGTGVYEKFGPHVDIHMELDLARCIGDLALHLQRVCELRTSKVENKK